MKLFESYALILSFNENSRISQAAKECKLNFCDRVLPLRFDEASQFNASHSLAQFELLPCCVNTKTEANQRWFLKIYKNGRYLLSLDTFGKERINYLCFERQGLFEVRVKVCTECSSEKPTRMFLFKRSRKFPFRVGISKNFSSTSNFTHFPGKINDRHQIRPHLQSHLVLATKSRQYPRHPQSKLHSIRFQFTENFSFSSLPKAASRTENQICVEALML